MFVPEELRYQNIRPKGWYSRFKEWPVQPLSSNTYWNPNQIVRFLMTLSNGVMDPYRSHIVFKVSVPQNMKVGLLQVDNSAQSFISQMVVSSNNKEIQRITQYDTFAAFMYDIGLSEIVCQNRQWQGLGYTNYQCGLANSARQGIRTSVQTNTGVGNHQYSGRGYDPTKYNMHYYGITTQLYPYMGNMGSSIFNSSNISLTQPDTGQYATQITDLITKTGLPFRLRYGYQPQLNLQDYIDTTTSYLTTFPLMNNGAITPASYRANTQAQPGQIPYKIDFAANIGADFSSGNITVASSALNIAPYWGYNRSVSSKYSIGCNEPRISNTAPLCQSGYGLISALPVPVPVRKFSIPLLSTILGILIPSDQFCLLPLQVLYNVLIQLTLSQFAMFTQGYSDYHEFDTYGIQLQQPRTWRISQMYFNLHVYQFPDQQISSYIRSSISKEITITGSSWMLSAQYQISSGTALRGNWQINVASDFLAEVVFLFLSNEYQKYTFCRKQFRLSHNIRSFQLKFNTDYYPAQPIVGNTGNHVMIDSSQDNQQFLQMLLMSYNYQFVTNTPQPRINTFNFSVNGRCYHPPATGTYFNPALKGGNVNKPVYGPQYNVNGDTAMGMPMFHQNRCVGRAAYVYPFQAHGHSRTAMVGVNSRNARPFQVAFDTWTQNAFPGDSTMYCFTRSNVVIVYGPNGIQVLGR